MHGPQRVYCNIVYWHELWLVQESETHWRETPRSFRREAPGPCRLLRTSTTPPLRPCHPRGEQQVEAPGVLARGPCSLRVVPGLKY